MTLFSLLSLLWAPIGIGIPRPPQGDWQEFEASWWKQCRSEVFGVVIYFASSAGRFMKKMSRRCCCLVEDRWRGGSRIQISASRQRGKEGRGRIQVPSSPTLLAPKTKDARSSREQEKCRSGWYKFYVRLCRHEVSSFHRAKIHGVFGSHRASRKKGKLTLHIKICMCTTLAILSYSYTSTGHTDDNDHEFQ